MKPQTLKRVLSRLYILKLVQAGPATVLNLAESLRERGFNENIRSLRPILRSLMMARAITAQLVEGSGRVYSITDEGRKELNTYLVHLEILQDSGREVDSDQSENSAT
ncbi:PadR family transcriptional regulator [Cupriavidus pauculus]|uniref:Transcriptional regulator n=1 Tax=Cupriavidus pauculus TaxID=82633 RepID=A0A2N5CDR1_9BURK|nr:helix-turn-helix transcriptional regulator [Cupriavidus pauculus]PLQ00344.1 transcriptional regulator [Cupriavidus pauculus]